MHDATDATDATEPTEPTEATEPTPVDERDVPVRRAQPGMGSEAERCEESLRAPLDDLQLSRGAERVLRLMLDGRHRTVGEICSALSLASSSASRAVHELVSRGLVIGPGGYGAKLGLGELGSAVRSHRTRLERQATARSQRLLELEKLWDGLGGEWPTGGDVVLPYGDSLDPLDLLRPERSYHAVFAAGDRAWEPMPMRSPVSQRGSRLDSRIVLARGASRPVWMGSGLRLTDEEVASFRVVDGIRAGVVIRRRGRTQEAWTFDRQHALMLRRLFDVLWEAASPEA